MVLKEYSKIQTCPDFGHIIVISIPNVQISDNVQNLDDKASSFLAENHLDFISDWDFQTFILIIISTKKVW